MKNFLIVFLLGCFALNLNAQGSCNRFFPFKKGTILEYENRSRKGKVEATTIQEVIEVSEKDGNKAATVKATWKGKKEKDDFTMEFGISCDGNLFKMDMRNFLGPQSQMMPEGQDVEMTIEGDGLTIPTDLEVGQTLPDSETIIKMDMGVMSMNTKIKITDHVVEGRETITTDAGKFDCLKVSYISETKVMMSKSSTKIVSWYADGVGAVKTESYNAKNNKLLSSQVLTKIQK